MSSIRLNVVLQYLWLTSFCALETLQKSLGQIRWQHIAHVPAGETFRRQPQRFRIFRLVVEIDSFTCLEKHRVRNRLQQRVVSLFVSPVRLLRELLLSHIQRNAAEANRLSVRIKFGDEVCFDPPCGSFASQTTEAQLF